MVLPGPRGAAIAAAAVGEDVKLAGAGIAPAALGAPPFLDAVDREGGGIEGGADEDGAGVGLGIVDAVGDGDAVCLGAEVVIADELRGPVPLGAGILEVADEFLLLGVDADDGEVLSGAAPAQPGDVLELGIAVRMRGAGAFLVVDAQGEAHRPEQPGDGSGRCPASAVRRRSWRWCGAFT